MLEDAVEVDCEVAWIGYGIWVRHMEAECGQFEAQREVVGILEEIDAQEHTEVGSDQVGTCMWS